MLKLYYLAALVVCASSDHINKNAQITNWANGLNADGTFQYGYETSNGIFVHETGIGGLGSRGSASWFSPDGQPFQLQWTADERGYNPVGNHLPTPPPTPDYVLNTLELIKQNQPNYDILRNIISAKQR
ncbi:hypothetical protein HA402_002878 [Bradysia odoriphaga]|nr:hypothetical protein HA402_002878 [Bradysia odoriphaga]